MNWWLMALAFVLGLVLTGLFVIRRVTREVPVYESGRATPAGLVGEKPNVDLPDVNAGATSATASAAAASKFTSPDGDAPTTAVPKVKVDDVDAPTTKVSKVGEVAAVAAAAAGGVAAAKLAGSGAHSATAKAKADDADAPTLAAPKVDVPDVDAPTTAVPKIGAAGAVTAAAAGGVGAAKLVGSGGDSATAKVDAPNVDASTTAMPKLGAAGAVTAAAGGGLAAAKLASSGGDSETPYGAGSFRGGFAPSGYDIKGNEDSMLYHTTDSPSYKQTIAEVWFNEESAAQRAGFTRWDKGRSGAAKFVAAADLPPGPHGLGSAAPAADGSGPEGWAIKGNEDSMLYHTLESPYYKRTIAEVWFNEESAAERAGFTRWDKGRAGAAKLAATEPELPPGPHGPGSATPAADGSGPTGWNVKGNADSMLYHSEESPAYLVTVAEVWFRDVPTAEAAGFNRWDSGKSQRGK